MSGASYNDYDQAYRQIHRGGKGVMPATVGLTAETVPLADKKPGAKIEEPGEVQRARETSDVMWRLNKYKTIDCDCGAKLRVPPNFKEPEIRCPHCGRIHRF